MCVYLYINGGDYFSAGNCPHSASDIAAAAVIPSIVALILAAIIIILGIILYNCRNRAEYDPLNGAQGQHGIQEQ